MNKRLRTILQYTFFFGLGFFFTWLSLRNLDAEKIRQIKSAFSHARQWLIIPVFFALLASHFIRGLRWRLLIESLGYKPSPINTFFAVMIGYLANMAVLRLGEVMKCTVLARTEKIPADELIGTIILERLIDAITVMLVFAITLALQPGLYDQLLETFFGQPSGSSGNSASTLVLTLVLLGIVAALVALWMIIRKKTFADLKRIVRRVWKSVIEGITAIRHLKKRGQFLVLTLLLWGIYLSGGYIGFMALRETQAYGIREAFTVLSAGSIGMIASPGGIGAYAYLIEKTMQLYGLSYTIALAFGWILWLAQTTVIVTGGLFSFVALPIYNKNRQHEKSRPGTDKNSYTPPAPAAGGTMETPE